MVVGMNKRCFTAICWTIPCLNYPGIAMACMKMRKKEMFLNVAACVNSENHLWCLKDYPSILLGTVCERGSRV